VILAELFSNRAKRDLDHDLITMEECIMHGSHGMAFDGVSA
jgi:hypothetical protein